MQRVHVVGTTGSGKTTLASQLAEHLGCCHVELDALHWEADWKPADDDVFRARIQVALEDDCWVVDGNYSRVRDLVWARVQLVVWLDYRLHINLWRVTRRQVVRALRGDELWESRNRESLRMLFLSRESLLVWAVRSHHRKRSSYLALAAAPENAHIHFVRLRSPRETERWLEEFVLL